MTADTWSGSETEIDLDKSVTFYNRPEEESSFGNIAMAVAVYPNGTWKLYKNGKVKAESWLTFVFKEHSLPLAVPVRRTIAMNVFQCHVRAVAAAERRRVEERNRDVV